MITDNQIKKMMEIIKENAYKPKKVKSKRMARLMTLDDPLGRKWTVGEEYYELHELEVVRQISLEDIGHEE